MWKGILATQAVALPQKNRNYLLATLSISFRAQYQYEMKVVWEFPAITIPYDLNFLLWLIKSSLFLEPKMCHQS
jgi:hypothetical protein